MKRVLLCHDNTIAFDIKSIAENLNKLCRSITFYAEKQPIVIADSVIKPSSTYRKLQRNDEISNKVARYDLILLATNKPYENNYFFDSSSNVVIISFFAWDELTTLPEANGLALFTLQLTGDLIYLGESHEDSAGCMNAFRWNKSDIDFCMRAAFVCERCKSFFYETSPSRESKNIFEGVNLALIDLLIASRSNLNILEFWARKNATSNFDVFLCHNDKDKPLVRSIGKQLKRFNLRIWLDEEQLRPGLTWQDILQEQISLIRSAAVFVGPNGIGPWQKMEIRLILQEFVNRHCPVIPVLLPGSKGFPELPGLLRQVTWVDFRKGKADPLKKLISGITDRKPDEQESLMSNQFTSS